MTTDGKVPAIALVGCGSIAEQFYLPALVSHPGVGERLILVDTDGDRLAAMGKAFGLATLALDYREVLAEADGAIIAAPPECHHRIALDFLKAGAHVLCEKPLAQTAAEAQQMVTAAQDAGTTLCVNNTRRLSPAYRKVRELIVNGHLGTLRELQYVEGREFTWPAVSGFRFVNTTAPRGVLLDIGSHVLDLICWWLGGKPRVVASANDSYGGSEAVARVELELDSCHATVELSWLATLPNTYRVMGDLATVEGDISDRKTVRLTQHAGPTRVVPVAARQVEYRELGQQLVANFLAVIAGRAGPLVPASEVLFSIQLVEECYAAATRMEMAWDAIWSAGYAR